MQWFCDFVYSVHQWRTDSFPRNICRFLLMPGAVSLVLCRENSCRRTWNYSIVALVQSLQHIFRGWGGWVWWDVPCCREKNLGQSQCTCAAPAIILPSRAQSVAGIPSWVALAWPGTAILGADGWQNKNSVFSPGHGRSTMVDSCV